MTTTISKLIILFCRRSARALALILVSFVKFNSAVPGWEDSSLERVLDAALRVGSLEQGRVVEGERHIS